MNSENDGALGPALLTVPRSALEHAVGVLDHDGDEHGVAGDLRAMIAAADSAAAEDPVQEVLARVAGKLRHAGARLPAPQAMGTVESALVTGLSIALALIEGEMQSGCQTDSSPVVAEARGHECAGLPTHEGRGSA